MTKQIIIDNETHKALRRYCAEESLMLKEAAIMILSQFLETNGYQIGRKENTHGNAHTQHDKFIR